MVFKFKYSLLLVFCIIIMCNIQSLATDITNNSFDDEFNNILNSPERFDDEFIEVFGYVSFEWESNAIYYTSKDIGDNNTKKAFYLMYDNWSEYIKYDGHYMYVRGYFDKDIKGWWGENGSFAGAIDVEKMIL